ncbi:MAG: UvrD-helicase domain-containing protein [Magnetococcus sp. WYHC-3]
MHDPILDHLNPPQYAAVTTLDGPLMILAGAGSGKTRVLTRRLAHILRSGAAAPHQVLAVTFTNKAAREMRERVAQLVGDSIPGGGWIGTFHSMGARLLRIHGRVLGYDPQFTILDSADQERLIRRVCAEAHFDDARWTPKRLTHTFGRWKDDGWLPETLPAEALANPRDHGRLRVLFQNYQRELVRAQAMDFGDLLLNCRRLWQADPELKTRIAQSFRYLLVDEYQDTNRVQYEWLQDLASVHGNLCVVGDDDQLIYSWRGARLDNILGFEQDHPGVTVIRLEQNYRSTSNILAAASGLIRHNRGRMAKTLWSESPPGDAVVWYTAEDGDDEARFIAREVAQSVGRSPRDFAILVRASWQTRALEDSLIKSGIAYRVVGGVRFMDRAEVKDALAYFRLAVSPRDDLACERVINLPRRGVGPTMMETLRGMARDQDTSLLVAVRGALAGGLLRPALRTALAEFVDVIHQAAEQLAQAQPLGQVLDFLVQRSGYADTLDHDEQGEERRANLRELADYMSGFDDATQFLEEAALVSDMGQSGEVGADSLTLSTLHAAKGLEFPVVFLAGMEEGVLPHNLAMEEQGEEGVEEERRLAYVGMTRARERLYLTHARRRFMFNRQVYGLPSRFLKELPAEVLEQRSMKVRTGGGLLAGVPRRREW